MVLVLRLVEICMCSRMASLTECLIAVVVFALLFEGFPCASLPLTKVYAVCLATFKCCSQLQCVPLHQAWQAVHVDSSLSLAGLNRHHAINQVLCHSRPLNHVTTHGSSCMTSYLSNGRHGAMLLERKKQYCNIIIQSVVQAERTHRSTPDSPMLPCRATFND